VGTRRVFLRTAAIAGGLLGGAPAGGLVIGRAGAAMTSTPRGGQAPAADPVPVALPGGPVVRDPYAGAANLPWWRGQLHTHTARSFDGDPTVSPERRAALYHGAGYDFTVFTDHDRVSALPSDAPVVAAPGSGSGVRPFLTIPGVESTHASAHLGVWLLGQEASGVAHDPPLVPSDRPPADRIEAWAEAGALVCCNHPSHPSAPLTAEQVASWAGGGVPFRFIEVFNTVASRTERDLAHSLEVWRQAVTAAGPERPVWGVAGDDSHGHAVGGSWVAVAAPSLTAAALRASLLAGRSYTSNGPRFTALGADAEAGGIRAAAPGAATIRFVGDDGRVALQTAGDDAVYRPPAGMRWVRAEASDTAGRTAWSQPFWLDT
jgi:hypothetical protein